MAVIFTNDIKQYISENYKGCKYKDLADKVNAVFSTNFTNTQIANFCCKNGFNNGCPRGGEETKYKKGHIPWHKGKTIEVSPKFKEHQFKKGNVPSNANPIGHEYIDPDGYTWVRVPCQYITASGKRKTYIAKHQLIWEQTYGKVPDGHKIIFLDGDKSNFNIDNLMLITDAEHLEMIRSDLRSTDSEITKAGALVAKIDCIIRKKVKRGKAN